MYPYTYVLEILVYWQICGLSKIAKIKFTIISNSGSGPIIIVISIEETPY